MADGTPRFHDQHAPVLGVGSGRLRRFDNDLDFPVPFILLNSIGIKMDYNNSKHEEHIVPYGMYILVWLGLLALTSITVTIAGIDFGTYTLIVALMIAAVKSALVINIFMHIKFDEPIFKLFLMLSGFTLVIILALTFVDYSFR